MGARTVLNRRMQPLQEDIDADLLTPRQRDILRLVSIGHTNREIAEVLDVSPDSMKSLLFRARRKMAALLGAGGEGR